MSHQETGESTKAASEARNEGAKPVAIGSGCPWRHKKRVTVFIVNLGSRVTEDPDSIPSEVAGHIIDLAKNVLQSIYLFHMSIQRSQGWM